MAKEQVTMGSAEFAKKWQERSKSASSYIVDGAKRVTVNPAEKAVLRADKWLNNVQQAKGRFIAGLQKTTLQSWQAAMAAKVPARHGVGVDLAVGKVQAFADYLIPTLNAGMSKVHSMPDMTLDDNINRAAAMMRHMAENKFKK